MTNLSPAFKVFVTNRNGRVRKVQCFCLSLYSHGASFLLEFRIVILIASPVSSLPSVQVGTHVAAQVREAEAVGARCKIAPPPS